MKRSRLLRRTPLRSRRRPTRPRPGEDYLARAAWKEPRSGFCTCGCGRFSMHLERHHVVEAQRIKQEGRWDLLWRLDNSMLLHPTCHARHTAAFRRIRIEYVPAPALQFALELLGEGPAAAYIERHYNCEVTV